MNFLSAFMAVFSVIAAIDMIFKNRFGLGKEFQKGFMLLGDMALYTMGMIVLAPLLGNLMQPLSSWVYNTFGIDPSILPAMFLANDMGAAALANTMAQNETLKLFNGLVVSSMMGCTISYTIPVALGIVKPEQHKHVLSGFLCGIITIPAGCFIVGLILKIPFLTLLLDLSPMIILSIIMALGLLYKPKLCIKFFAVLGTMLKILITIGLVLGIIKFLTGIEIVKGLDSLEEAGMICLNASAVMSGSFPFVYLVSKLIKRPLNYLGKKLHINKASAIGLFSSLTTSLTTFQSMEAMDEKGIMLNSAFAVSAAFIFASHLAFTLAFSADYVSYVIIAKLISGISALILANFMYKRLYK